MRRRLLIRILISALVLIPFVLHNRQDVRIGFLDRLENLAYDIRLRVTMPNSMDERIVIVDLDERSLAVEGQWPWPRDKLGALIDRLFDDYSITTVGFDVIFPEPDRSSGLAMLDTLAENHLSGDPGFRQIFAQLRPTLEYDQIFAKALAGRNTVLGHVFYHTEDRDKSSGGLPPPVFDGPHGTRIDFLEASSHLGNLTVLSDAARSGGYFDNPTVDADGVYRRVPVMQSYQGQIYESLAMALSRASMGFPPIEFQFFSGLSGPRDALDLDWLKIGDYTVPVGPNTTVLVPYRGPEGSFPYVSATDVLSGTAPKYPLQGAIVLLGTSAAGLRDSRVTPVGRSYNGVEVHANIISGLLDQRIKHHPRFVQGIEISIIALVALLMTVMMARAPVITATLGTMLVMLLVLVLNLELWQEANFVIPVAPTLVLIFVLFFVHTLYGYLGETRSSRMLSVLFGQYVPPELVEEMARNPSAINMDSDNREMTVMFSDVHGFTSIAEGLEPRELSQLMNEFLTPMTRVIHRHRGTIDKYMGDAIMAFWGAPLPDRDHARNALLAGMEMQGAMRELRSDFESRGWPVVRIGIGVSSGMMRVGNMGSEFRQAYTVMGDAVNLGARIEGLTREYHVGMIVTAETVDHVPEFSFLELDLVRVKGKDRPVAIFEPLGPEPDLAPGLKRMVARHKQALRLYRKADWDSAEREFFMLHQSYAERKLFQIYLDRIAYFRNNPPGDSWDGVFTYLTK